MFRALVLCATAVVPTLASAANWTNDYGDALKRAKSQDKPVLVVFHNGPAVEVAPKFVGKDGLADKFVLVYADKRNAEGQQLFDLFEIRSDRAAVVVEREQAWQFARYERELSDLEAKQLMERTATAKGIPAGDVLTPVSTVETAPAQSSAMPMTIESGMISSPGSYCPSCQRRGR